MRTFVAIVAPYPPIPFCPEDIPCRDKLLRDPSGKGGESSEIWGFTAPSAVKPQISLSSARLCGHKAVKYAKMIFKLYSELERT